MSKYVKNLVARDIARRLQGVEDAVLVNVVGMSANQTCVLRKRLREKMIHLLVVKNSMARRAMEGTPLSPAFDGLEGPLAILWGGEDFITLVKEVTQLHKTSEFEKFLTRGGVMDGERLTPERIEEISKWPNRQQQLSILVGQALAPGARLLAQMRAPGGRLASQIKKKSEQEGDA